MIRNNKMIKYYDLKRFLQFSNLVFFCELKADISFNKIALYNLFCNSDNSINIYTYIHICLLLILILNFIISYYRVMYLPV